MDAQIVLGKIAAAAAHLVNLRMHTFVSRQMRDTSNPRSDTAAVGFRADGLDLDPVVAGAGIATEQLGIIVDRIDDHVEVSVIVEVSERTTPRGNWCRDAGPGVERN